MGSKLIYLQVKLAASGSDDRTERAKPILKSPKLQAEFIEPMQCLLVNKLPEGEEWERA
jgi:hypothetical protein